MEAIRYENSEIDERIIRAVTEIGYEEMTPIQQSAIPALLEGRDIIGQAQTGTGKTAAFGGGSNVEFKIRGADLVGAINNYTSRKRG